MKVTKRSLNEDKLERLRGDLRDIADLADDLENIIIDFKRMKVANLIDYIYFAQGKANDIYKGIEDILDNLGD